MGVRAPGRGGCTAPRTHGLVLTGRTPSDTGESGEPSRERCRPGPETPRRRRGANAEQTGGREGSKEKGQIVDVGAEARARQAAHLCVSSPHLSLFMGSSPEGHAYHSGLWGSSDFSTLLTWPRRACLELWPLAGASTGSAFPVASPEHCNPSACTLCGPSQGGGPVSAGPNTSHKL